MSFFGKHLKKPEFSKVISSIAIVFWLIVNVFGMYMMFITLDLSQLMYIVGSADAVVAVVYAVYAHKARAENMIKLRKIYGSDADCVLNNYNNYDDYDSYSKFDNFVDGMEKATLKF